MDALLRMLCESIGMDFVVGLLSTIIITAIVKLSSKVFELIRARKFYAITGFWLGSYQSFYKSDLKAIDVVWIRIKKKTLIVSFQQYQSDMELVHTWYGSGFYDLVQGNVAVTYYYSSYNGYQNGVMLLTQVHRTSTQIELSGKFFEFSGRDSNILNGMSVVNSHMKIYSSNYYAYRLNLSLYKKILYILNKKLFLNYNEIKNALEKLSKQINCANIIW